MKDIQKIMNDQFSKYMDEKFDETLQKHLAEMMDKVLDNVFSRYGDDGIAKTIEKQLKAGLNVNIGNTELMQYNGMVADAIGNYFKNIIEERNLTPIKGIIEGIVGKDGDGEIATFDRLISNIEGKITDIIDDDYHRKADDIGKNYSIFADYDKKNGWINVYCDSDMDEEKERCYIKFSISNRNNQIFSVHFGSRKSHQEKHYNGLEFYINNLYLSGAKIKEIDWEKLDHGDIDLDVGSYDPY